LNPSDAAFNYSVSTNSVNQIFFTAFNTNLECSWDFGDGTSANGYLVRHYYSNSGIYIVNLSVRNENSSSEFSRSLNIVCDDWYFDDNIFTDPLSNRLGFVGVVKPPFVVNDKINIVQNIGSQNPDYDGVSTITDIHQNSDKRWVVSVDKLFLTSSPQNPGKISLLP
jgi:PKD repeat protein